MAPNRRVRIDWLARDGERVCVEATLSLDPDSGGPDVPLCIHFTMDAEERRFVRDRTYIDSSITAGLAAGSAPPT
jgi:hypothetical protein